MNLTKHAIDLLDAIRIGKGDFVDRGFIAAQLGRKTFGGADAAILDLLEENGIVESRQVDVRTPTGTKWEYRIKQERAE